VYVDLVAQLPHVDVRAELAQLDGLGGDPVDQLHPLREQLRQPVAHDAGPGVELEVGVGEETAAGQPFLGVERDSPLVQRPQPAYAARRRERRADHMRHPLLHGTIDGRELQLLL
jgi:hypothetical protein